MKLIYILYKTVRIETGEYYIGVHGIDTDKYPRFNDPYLGSGDRIKASRKKHGKKEFKRSILSISESRDVVLALEAAMVTAEMIADPLCLNLAPGGRGGVKGVRRSAEHRQAISNGQRGSKRSVETCQAISDALKGRSCPGVIAALKGFPKSVEHRQALSDALKGRPAHNKGVPHSAETRQSISDALTGSTRSAEHCQALSDALKGRPAHNKGVPSPLKGVSTGPMSAETRQTISDSMKRYWLQKRNSSNKSMDPE